MNREKILSLLLIILRARVLHRDVVSVACDNCQLKIQKA